MDNFRVGEVAIGINCRDPSWNGMECQIIRNLHSRMIYNGLTGEAIGVRDVYGVKWEDEVTSFQEPRQLRKKHEPGNWENLKDEMGRPIWNPMITVGEG